MKPKNSPRKNNLSFAELPGRYADLVALLPPRPIGDEIEYQNTVEMIDAMAGHKLKGDQADYLEALSLMVEAYEREQRVLALARVRPHQVLAYLLEERGMRVKDLAQVLGSQPLASMIARGQREMSKEVIVKLAGFFNVSPATFLPVA